MKDVIDSMPTERPLEQEGFANRKLIRPSLNRNDHNSNHTQAPMERRERPAGGGKKPRLPRPQTPKTSTTRSRCRAKRRW